MSSAVVAPQQFLGKHQELEIDKLFRAVVKLSGSDLHLKVDLPPFVRVNGTLRPLNREAIDDEEMVRLIFPMINMQERRKRIFEEDGGVDFAYMLDVDGEQLAVPRERLAADGPRRPGRPPREPNHSRL